MPSEPHPQELSDSTEESQSQPEFAGQPPELNRSEVLSTQRVIEGIGDCCVKSAEGANADRFTSIQSVVFGLAGLTALLTSFAAMFVLVVFALSESDFFEDPFVLLMLVVQSVYWPPFVSFAFTVTTCIFRCGRIAVRCALAFLLCLPAYALLCCGLMYLDADADVWRDVFVTMFPSIVAIAATVLFTQALSGCSLSVRNKNEAIRRQGIGGLIELTMLAAVSLATLMIWDLMDYVEAILLMAAILVPACLATLAVQIAYLGQPKSTWTLKIGFLACVSISVLVLNAFSVHENFGQGFSSVIDHWWTILLLTLFGILLVMLVTWLQLAWLRFCGWTCVNWRELAIQRDCDDELSKVPHPLDS